MKYRYVIIGAGRQGIALAYDLARNGEAAATVLADRDEHALTIARERLRELCNDWDGEIAEIPVREENPDTFARIMRGADVVISAAPYRLNEMLTDAAIAAGASFCDLGGNTAVVRAQLERHARAAAAGVSVVPDCGLAPGLGNHLAAHGVGRLTEPRGVHVRCGGLPEKPVGPLGYKMLFNFQGLINEYSGMGEFLRDGRIVEVPTLTELEDIEFEQLGRCEAAVTSGGTSTCPTTFLGQLDTYDYKTVRYPGHFATIRAMFELGCFDEVLRARDGSPLRPKQVMQELFETRLAFPIVRDIVVLRVVVSGNDAGRKATLQYDLFDRFDEKTRLTAMERTTAFPAALVAHMQARRLIEPGARPLEVSVPAEQFVAELPGHDIHVRQKRS